MEEKEENIRNIETYAKNDKKENDKSYIGLLIFSAVIPLFGILGGFYQIIKGKLIFGTLMICLGIIFSFIYSRII